MARFNLRVVPNAKKAMLKRASDGSLKLYVNKPAIDGKANEALIKYIAKLLGISKGKVSIVSGGKSREKSIEAELPQEEAMAILNEAALK